MKKGIKYRVTIVAFLAASGLAAIYAASNGREDSKETTIYKEEIVSCGDLLQGITERGNLTFLTSDQKFDVVIDDTAEETDDEEESRYLKIEEVYVCQGQRIRAGDPVYKVTERSMRSIRRYLEAKAADAGVLLEEKQSEYEAEAVKAVKAEGVLQKSLSDQAWAETLYAVEMAKAETEDVLTADSLAVLEQEIRQIETELEDGYEEYADLKEEYEKYKRRYEEWDPDNLYTYVPLRSEYLEQKQRYEEETKKREDKRGEILDKQEEIQDIREEIARLSAGDGAEEMEARQRRETGSGLVTQVSCEEGDILREGATLLSWVEEGDCLLSVDVSEEDISAIETGDDVIVVFTAWPEDTYEGCVWEIESTTPSRNTAAVSYCVTVKMEGDTSKLYGGMTGDVTFITDQVTQAIYVSRRAVTEEEGKTWVRIRGEDGEITRREVETGFSNGTQIQILDGLSAGDTVYIETKVRGADKAEDTLITGGQKRDENREQ